MVDLAICTLLGWLMLRLWEGESASVCGRKQRKQTTIRPSNSVRASGMTFFFVRLLGRKVSCNGKKEESERIRP